MEGVVAAKRVEDGRVEIEFPTGTTTELHEKEKSRITPLINKAFGREVVINYLGASGPPYEHGKMCAHWVYLQYKQSDFYSAQRWLRNKCRYHDIFERK